MIYLHCNNNTQLNKTDKYVKIRPLYYIINKIFFEFAPIEENNYIDESMVPYYRQHGGKQFIKCKLIRWGFKFWTACLRLGYIVYFDSYQGSSCTLPNRYKHLGLGS